MSFDDCPLTLTQLDNALNWLAVNNVGAMLFPTGNCISSFRVNATVDSAYAAKGMREVLWTVDTTDWTGKTAAQVVSYVVTYGTARSMVPTHMGWNGFYPTSLAQMQAGLARRGLALCRAYPGTAPVLTPNSLPC